MKQSQAGQGVASAFACGDSRLSRDLTKTRVTDAMQAVKGDVTLARFSMGSYHGIAGFIRSSNGLITVVKRAGSIAPTRRIPDELAHERGLGSKRSVQRVNNPIT